METVFRVLVSALVWFAIALQYWLVMSGETGPAPLARTINFFSYFTILCNVLVALAMSLPWLAPHSGPGRFFSRSAVRTAIATYIIVVAVTYHLVLRELWDPQGWQWVADNLLHYVAPVLFVLDWLLFVPKAGVAWKNALLALVFPLAYIAWTFVHGAWSGWYPYPFVDVAALGWAKVLQNSAVIFAALAVLGLLLVGIAHMIGRHDHPPKAANS